MLNPNKNTGVKIKGAISLKFLIPFIAFITIAIFLGIGLSLNPRDLPSTMIDKQAPEFELNLLSSPEQVFSPEDLLGSRWVLNVWASWCVACRVEHPILNEIANRTDIIMVGLNYKDDPNEARQWLSERGDPYDFKPMDSTGDAGIDWGVYGVPETFVIDENGIVIYKHTGPMDAAAVEVMLPLVMSNDLAKAAL